MSEARRALEALSQELRDASQGTLAGITYKALSRLEQPKQERCEGFVCSPERHAPKPGSCSTPPECSCANCHRPYSACMASREPKVEPAPEPKLDPVEEAMATGKILWRCACGAVNGWLRMSCGECGTVREPAAALPKLPEEWRATRHSIGDCGHPGHAGMWVKEKDYDILLEQFRTLRAECERAQEQVRTLSKRPTRADMEAAESRIAALESEIATAREDAAKAERERIAEWLRERARDDAKTHGEAFNRAWAALHNAADVIAQEKTS